MKKTHRKIVSGALLCGCALFTLYGASRIAERAENGVSCRLPLDQVRSTAHPAAPAPANRGSIARCERACAFHAKANGWRHAPCQTGSRLRALPNMNGARRPAEAPASWRSEKESHPAELQEEERSPGAGWRAAQNGARRRTGRCQGCRRFQRTESEIPRPSSSMSSSRIRSGPPAP